MVRVDDADVLRWTVERLGGQLDARVNNQKSYGLLLAAVNVRSTYMGEPLGESLWIGDLDVCPKLEEWHPAVASYQRVREQL